MASHNRIAITGSRGLLGSTLMSVLQESEYEPIALTSNVSDREAVSAEIAACEPAWIIHTAAKTDVGWCERNPGEAYEANALGTKNVIEAARTIDARVICISTVSVFDGHTGNYTEEDAPHPVNVYNDTKRQAELAALEYDNGMIVRLNLIGIHPNVSRAKNFLEWLVSTARENKDMTLFNDQFVNPLSNWTVAIMLQSLITKELYEPILHLGSQDRLSKAEIGKNVLARFPEYTGTVTEKSVDTITDGVVRPKQMWLNCERAHTLLGPLPLLRDELELIFSQTNI